MPCLCRMNRYITQGLLWLYIISTGLFVVSLEPGYLDFDNLPDTNFSCVGKVIGGYYADLETNCQMFHVCTIGQLDEPMDIRFLCLNGTVFDQETRVCERIDEVDCSKSEKFYSLNLELYGNTAPPILEENAETESPLIEKPASSTTTTTTTTTTPRPTTTTTTRTHYFSSSSRPLTPSPYHKGPSSHHFSLEQAPSYSPEEINISLNPGASPHRPFEFPPHNHFSGNVGASNQKTVTTPSSVFKDDDNDENEHSEDDNSRFSSSTTESHNNYNQNSQSSQNTFKYNFNYHDTRPREYNPSPSNNYQYHHNYANFRPPVVSNNPYQNNPYRSSTQKNEYLPVTRKNFEVRHPSSTSRSFFLQPIKSPSHQYFTRAEKPQGDQIPPPVVPSISPIVFSSPAPFALSRHIETKRYTDEHELPPRIIISASASVSDASGRTLNYSLGTIGAAQILARPPSSYDDYKESDVVLDPFYHDVPKIQTDEKRIKRDISENWKDTKESDISAKKIFHSKLRRSKRSPQSINPSEIIKNEEEAVEVLKFLFDWYKGQEKTTKSPLNIPVSPELITNINEQFSLKPYVPEDYEDEQSDIVEKDAVLEDHEQEVYSSHHSEKTSNFGNNLLQRATRVQSSNIRDNNGKVLRDMKKDPTDSTYRDHQIHEEQSRTYFNNYHNPPIPPHQKVEKTIHSENTKETKPYRGRHRFTFPYSATPSPSFPETLENEEHFGNRRLIVQNTSQKNYEEFYEQQREKNNQTNANSYISNNGKEYSGDTKNHNETVDEYSASPSAILQSTSQKPFLQRFDEIHEQLGSKAPERHRVEDDTASQVVDQDYDQPENNKLSTRYPSFESQTNTRKKIESYSVKEGSDNFTTKVPDDEIDIEVNQDESQMSTNQIHEESTKPYAGINTYDYVDDNYETGRYILKEGSVDFTTKLPDSENDIELSQEKSQMSTNQVYEVSTKPYSDINTYDYVDDNYEPFTYNETSEEEKHLKQNAKDEVRGIIHEETNINIDNIDAETPDEQKFVTSNQNNPSIANREKSDNSKSVDRNISSFADILSSLHNFQKNEQEIFNYHNNLTDIEDLHDEKTSTISSDEFRTFEFSLHLESTTSADFPNTQDVNQNERKSLEKESEFTGLEETVNSTTYKTEATENSSTSDGEHLYTSKPLSIGTTNSNHTNEQATTKYQVQKSEITAIPVPTTYQTESTTQNSEETTSSSGNEYVAYTSDGGSKTEKYYSKQREVATNNGEHTTISLSVVDDEKEKVFLSHIPKPNYRGKYRGQKRPSKSSRRRIENTPVYNFFREITGRRRKSRVRQQNKPFYNQDPYNETRLPISTTPSISTYENSEMSTITDSVTELPIAINETPSEGISTSSFLLNSTPRGFYVTKFQKENGYADQYPTSRNINEESIVTHTTEYFSETENSSTNAVEESPSTVPIYNFPDDEETSTSSYNVISTDFDSMLETTMQATSASATYTPIDSSSNDKTNFTEEYSDNDIDSKNQKENKTLSNTEETSVVPTTDISSIATSEASTFDATQATNTFSTLNLRDIETTTNSIVDFQSIKHFNQKESYVKYTEVIPNITRSVSTTETTSGTTDNFQYEEDLKTENITYQDAEYTKNTPQVKNIGIIETVISNTEKAQGQVGFEEENFSGKEVHNKPNKEEPLKNRDGRKYKDRRLHHKTKDARNRISSRHRFSSAVTPGNLVSVKPSNYFKHRFSTTRDVAQQTSSKRPEKEEYFQHSDELEGEGLTEIALSKNVKPTLATSKGKNFSTTPMLYKVQLRKERVNKNYVFNCFGKPLNRFYSDPRDCRLFHYCTNGYSKNQLLDMKFVCDLGTHFDDEKLVCTREIPKRCS